MAFIDEFMKTFGPQVSNGLANNLGVDQKTAMQLIPQIAPLILGGLKKQMETQGGAPRVDHILNKYGSASVLQDIAGIMTKQASSSSLDPKLGGLLGQSGVQAASTLAKQFKLDPSVLTKMIPMLAPFLLGALSQKRDAGLGVNGIASLIDQNGDGNILDDVAGFLLKSLTGSGTSKTKTNPLGSLLGSLLGRRKTS